MNREKLQVLAAIAEVVSAIAIVVSLIYVGYEFRRTGTLSSNEVDTILFERVREMNGMLIENETSPNSCCSHARNLIDSPRSIGCDISLTSMCSSTARKSPGSITKTRSSRTPRGSNGPSGSAPKRDADPCSAGSRIAPTSRGPGFEPTSTGSWASSERPRPGGCVSVRTRLADRRSSAARTGLARTRSSGSPLLEPARAANKGFTRSRF